MQEASGFLKRFKYLLQKKEDNLNIIISVIKDVVGIDLSKEDLKIKNKILMTNLSGGEKGQIFLHKQRIIEEINSKSDKVIITDLH